MTPDMGLLRGLSYPTAELYGKPCIGAHYTAFDLNKHRVDHMARCCICGGMASNAHHWPPRSKRSFTLRTPYGQFVLLPPLFAVCGSGTTGCHGDWHRRLIEVEWVWDFEEMQESWWDGTLLKRHAPGDWLFEHGRYLFHDKRNGRTWEMRG